MHLPGYHSVRNRKQTEESAAPSQAIIFRTAQFSTFLRRLQRTTPPSLACSACGCSKRPLLETGRAVRTSEIGTPLVHTCSIPRGRNQVRACVRACVRAFNRTV